MPSVGSCGRSGHTFFYISGKIYVLSRVYSDSCTDSLHLDKFDISSNTWSFISTAPIAKYDLTACSAKSKIYVIAGTAGSAQSSVEEYDPSTNQWSTKSPIPYGRLTEHACVTVSDKIYLIGGSLNDSGSEKLLYVYDP